MPSDGTPTAPSGNPDPTPLPHLGLLRAYAALTYPFACVPFLYFYFADHGVDLADYGLLVSAYYVTMVAAEIPTGLFADHRGKRLALVLGPAVLATGFWTIGLAPGMPGFYAGEILLGLGHSILSGPPAALLFDLLARAGRSGDFRRQESICNSLRLLGTGVAFLLGGATVALGGIPAAIALTGVLCCAASVVALRLPPDTAHDTPDGDGPARPRLAPHRLLGAAATELNVGPLRWMLAYFCVLFFLLRFPFHTYQPYLREAGAQNPWGIGLLFFALNLFAAPFSRMTPWVCQRLGTLPTLLAMPTVLALSLAAMGGRADGIGIALFFLHQVPFGMHVAVVQDFVQHRIGDRARATVASILSFVGRLGFAVVFPLALGVGSIGDAYLAVGIVGLLGTAGCALWARRI